MNQSNNRANILFIFPDQWRGDCLGIANHPVVRTPFVDTLALEGIRFTHAYTPSPTCIPARASLLTGQSPSLCGRQGYQDKVPWEFTDTFLDRLNAGGYQTINVGKTHFYPQGNPLGFEVHRSYDPQYLDEGFESDYHVWLRETTGDQVRDTAREFPNNTWVPLPWTHPEPLHCTNWTADSAIAELQGRDSDRPFFLQVGFHRPHPPYDPPWSLFQRYANIPLPPIAIGDWCEATETGPIDADTGIYGRLPKAVQEESCRAYYAACTHVDQQIGKIIYALKRLDLYKDTWIVFASDHGEMLGDHDRRHKIVPWEGSAKIPLIIRPPQGRGDLRPVCEAPVTLTDLAPTFLDLAGIHKPAAMDALSLLPWMTGGSAAQPCRDYVHGEHSPCWHFVTDGREKLIWNSKSQQIWFFDLTTDPKECRNLLEEPSCARSIATWKARLASTLYQPHRRADGLSDGHNLLGGSTAAIRPK
jgi:arylsulfatase A-like enzyme